MEIKENIIAIFKTAEKFLQNFVIEYRFNHDTYKETNNFLEELDKIGDIKSFQIDFVVDIGWEKYKNSEYAKSEKNWKESRYIFKGGGYHKKSNKDKIKYFYSRIGGEKYLLNEEYIYKECNIQNIDNVFCVLAELDNVLDKHYEEKQLIIKKLKNGTKI